MISKVPKIDSNPVVGSFWSGGWYLATFGNSENSAGCWSDLEAPTTKYFILDPC